MKTAKLRKDVLALAGLLALLSLVVFVVKSFSGPGGTHSPGIPIINTASSYATVPFSFGITYNTGYNPRDTMCYVEVRISGPNGDVPTGNYEISQGAPDQNGIINAPVTVNALPDKNATYWVYATSWGYNPNTLELEESIMALKSFFFYGP